MSKHIKDVTDRLEEPERTVAREMYLAADYIEQSRAFMESPSDRLYGVRMHALRVIEAVRKYDMETTNDHE